MEYELPARPDLDWYRKQAKELLRTFERGEPEARARVRRQGAEPGRFALGNAQWVVARELGCRSWSELKTLVEGERRDAPAPGGRDAGLLAAFEAARATWGERGEARLDTGLRYGGTRPLVVAVRRRPGHYSFSDEGGAVEAAGRPRGWLEAARAVVDEQGLNMNLRGVVWMGAAEQRETAWLHSIASRVADTSLAVYEALLELDG